MKTKIFFLFFFFLVSCAYREVAWIEPPAQRVIVKEVPGLEKPQEKEEFYESSRIFPNLTLGYIANKSFPYLPKVWLIKGGQKIVLIGPEQGPPDFAIDEIRESNLPPGIHILHVERWRNLGAYGGWQKIPKVEVVRISVAQFKPGGWRYWADSHYGWWMIIYPDYTEVYSGYIK